MRRQGKPSPFCTAGLREPALPGDYLNLIRESVLYGSALGRRRIDGPGDFGELSVATWLLDRAIG